MVNEGDHVERFALNQSLVAEILLSTNYDQAHE